MIAIALLSALGLWNCKMEALHDAIDLYDGIPIKTWYRQVPRRFGVET